MCLKDLDAAGGKKKKKKIIIKYVCSARSVFLHAVVEDGITLSLYSPSCWLNVFVPKASPETFFLVSQFFFFLDSTSWCIVDSLCAERVRG